MRVMIMYLKFGVVYFVMTTTILEALTFKRLALD